MEGGQFSTGVDTFPQRSPPRLFTDAACGGLGPPPAGRSRRVDSSIAGTASLRLRSIFYIAPSSAFVAHGGSCAFRSCSRCRRRALFRKRGREPSRPHRRRRRQGVQQTVLKFGGGARPNDGQRARRSTHCEGRASRRSPVVPRHVRGCSQSVLRLFTGSQLRLDLSVSPRSHSQWNVSRGTAGKGRPPSAGASLRFVAQS